MTRGKNNLNQLLYSETILFSHNSHFICFILRLVMSVSYIPNTKISSLFSLLFFPMEQKKTQNSIVIATVVKPREGGKYLAGMQWRIRTIFTQASISLPLFNADPFDSYPKNFWQEFSSPFTDTPEENEIEDGEETTTHEPFPFFDEPNGSVNVTTHLGNSVYLHCRVNDLNGKTVSDLFYAIFG